MQKSISAFGGLLLLRAAIASLLAMIVYMSVAFVFTSIGTREIGFTAYREENGTLVRLDDYYFDDLDELQAKAQEIQNSKTVDEETGKEIVYKTQSIRSEMPRWMKVVSFIIAEVCMIGMYTSMLYVTAWEDGNKSRTQVRHENGKEEPLRGLKAGLIASIPCAIAWLVLLLSRCFPLLPNFGGTVKWFFIPYFPIVASAIPTAAAADVAWWVFPMLLALAAVKPLTCHFAYRMGYADRTLKAILLYKGDEKAARKKRK